MLPDVKVVDTLPAGVGFVSATGTDWTCANAAGTVTCAPTGNGNLATGAAAPITSRPQLRPAPAPWIANERTISSPNDTTDPPRRSDGRQHAAEPGPRRLSAPPRRKTDTLRRPPRRAMPTAIRSPSPWTWKVTRGANTCTIQTNSSALAATGTRTASLDLSATYTAGSTCSRDSNAAATINPSKATWITAEATPTDAPGLIGTLRSSTVTIANTAPTVTLSGANNLSPNEGSTYTYNYSIRTRMATRSPPSASELGTGNEVQRLKHGCVRQLRLQVRRWPRVRLGSRLRPRTPVSARPPATQRLSDLRTYAPTIAISGAPASTRARPTA